MRIFSGVLLILMSFLLLSGSFKKSEQAAIDNLEITLKGRILYYQDHVRHHPIHYDFAKADYNQEMTDLENSEKAFRETWIETRPLSAMALDVLIIVAGLLYLAAGMSLLMKLKWVTPVMAAAFCGYLVFIVLLWVHLTALNNDIFQWLKDSYKVQATLGLLDGDYYQIAAGASSQQANAINTWLLGGSALFLAIPTVYLIKSFFQEEEKPKSFHV